MDIGTEVRELDTVEAVVPLIGAVLQLPETSWLEESSRQVNYRVHAQTKSLVLLFCDSEWPEMQVQKKSAWKHLSGAAVPVMREILQKHYDRGGVILRAIVARLPPHGTIAPHVDGHPSFSCAHRIHVPLLTNPQVAFHVGGKRIAMDVGKAYEINNQLVHQVHNGGGMERIHFIFDYVPPRHVAGRPAGTA